MAFQPNIGLSKRFLAFIYGGGGVGKSTAAFSLLKNPKLKLVHIALDPTTDFALENVFGIYGIEDIEEGQLIYVKPQTAALVSESATLNRTDSTLLTNFVKTIHNTVGIDVKTNKQVQLRGFDNKAIFNENTVIVIDGFSNFVMACEAKAKAESLTKDGVYDTLRGYGFLGGLVKGLHHQIVTTTSCHVIFCGHEQQSDEKARSKYVGLPEIHPYVGTRSYVTTLMGNMSFVFYAKRDTMTNKFVLSVAEPRCFVRDRLDRVKFAAFIAEYNKDKKPNEKIDLSNLPQDLTHECYDFLK